MKKYDVLIIDDEEGIRDVVGGYADIAGFSYETAESASHAMDLLLEKSAPYLIICDISMPGMNGLELLEKVRSKGFQSAVVMLTAYSESNKIIEALRLGALDYICKPFPHEVLTQNLAIWVEIGKRLQALVGDKQASAQYGNVSQQLRMIELYRLKSKALQDLL